MTNERPSQGGRERRQYIRIPFQKKITYRVCYRKFMSKDTQGETENLSTGGILFKTKWPPPVYSIIKIPLDMKRFKDYIREKQLQDAVTLEKVQIKNNCIFGEVLRIKEYPESGFYDVAIRLILKDEFKNKKEQFGGNDNTAI